ncbi:translation initiation factor IF-2-like [Pollicipes pollicipes]|uniref:translation initiation factor IF-2-like n=1 Tax=Pollicipes pollicipes TaxID=41117 RepID=UPI001884A8F7|nr:translation initiation factor IF-2-like [Pollicipes pollicipes]
MTTPTLLGAVGHRPCRDSTDEQCLTDRWRRPVLSSGGVKKGISSVFSKLAADRVARSREDRDGGEPAKPRKPADTADSDSSAGSGSADSFLNHLLSPPVVPPAEEGAEPALRRPAGLAGTDLLAEMRAKQEKRASLTPKHTPEELEERSPLQEVKGRSAALAAALKSPSAGHHGPPSISPKPSLASKPKQASPVPGLAKPPPLGPKPRPKSMAGRTETRCSGGGNTSGDETPPADVGPSSDSWTGRQMADGAAANSSSRASDSPTDGSGAPSAQRQPKRLTSAELESLLESSVDGPPPSEPSIADGVSPSPVPNLILDQAYSLDDVINV